MGARAQHNPAYRRFRAMLRQWRIDAGLTQRDLAQRLKKPPSYVHKSEVGDRRIDPIELVVWCRACDVKPSTAICRVEKLV
jgi:transcriptional regulator with XRE-family HTH domain